VSAKSGIGSLGCRFAPSGLRIEQLAPTFSDCFAMLAEDHLSSPAACGDVDILLARPALRTRPAPAYTVTARVLHWITAVLILLAIPLGVISANELGGPNWLYDLHRSLGAVLIPVVIARLISRCMHPPMPLSKDISGLQRQAAHVMHWALYALLIAQPLVGWMATSAYPAPIWVFGWFELPPIWFENRALSEQLFSVHRLIGIAMACLVTAHVGAALFHHFVRKDRILMRMITG
jgi:cytochrome b561